MTKKETRVIKIGIFIFLMNLIFTSVAILLFMSSSSDTARESQKLAKDFLNATKAASGIQAVLFVIGANCPPGFTPYTAAEGRFILGAANGDQVTGGSNTITVAQMPSHNHGQTEALHPVVYGAGTWSGGGFDGGTGAHSDTGYTGGGAAYWQPYIRLKPCIWQHN